MTTHLFFVSSPRDIDQTIRLTSRLPLHSWVIVSNNPIASLALSQRGVLVKDSGNFFPRSRKLRDRYWQIVKLTKTWSEDAGMTEHLHWEKYRLAELVEFSLNIFLCEVEHSILTAAKIVDSVRPEVIHVSPEWSESPARRYQSDQLNLENLALMNLAQIQKISLKVFSRPGYQLQDRQETVAATIRAGLYSFRQLNAHHIGVKAKPLTILAHHYQLDNLKSLWPKFKNHQNYLIIGNTNQEQEKNLNKFGLPFVPLSQLFPTRQKLSHSMLKDTLQFIFLWREKRNAVKAVFDDFDPLYWPLVEKKMKYYFYHEFPLIVEHLRAGEAFFSGGSGKVLITAATNDTISKCYVLTAAAFGVKIIELQHGMVVFDEEWPFRYNHIHAVWGKSLKQIISQGKTPALLSVTGFPYFDRYRGKIDNEKLRQEGRKTMGIGENQRLILILSVFPIAADRLTAISSPTQFFSTIFASLKKTRQAWKILFRPHPSNEAGWVKTLAETSEVEIIYDRRKYSLEQSIAASDVVIANFTTAMIDALFLDKPVFIYSFAEPTSVELQRHPMMTTGAVKTFESAKELSYLLNRSISDRRFLRRLKSGRKSFLHTYCSIDKKFACDRLFDLIRLIRIDWHAP